MTKLRYAPVFGCMLMGATVLTGIPVAMAQSDPSTQQIIERLAPRPATRGIRVPGAGGGDTPPAVAPDQPAAAAPVAPGAPTPLLPQTAAPTAPAPEAPPRVASTPPAAGGKPAEPARVPAAAAPQAEAPAAIDFPIYFPSGSATLTPQAQQQLANLGRALVDPRLANFRFRIEGHTDTVGDPMMNQTLSERRAAAVRDYLIRQYGVRAERLQAIGLGEAQLAVPTRDETPEPRNRRVRVVNLDS